jgi:hypothetical protein
MAAGMTIADRRRRPQIVIGKTVHRRALAERCDLQRKLGAAHAGPRDRLDADDLGGFLDRAGFQAGDLGLGTPRFALGGLKKSAAATRQRDKDDGADEIQTNSTRHPPTFDELP